MPNYKKDITKEEYESYQYYKILEDATKFLLYTQFCCPYTEIMEKYRVVFDIDRETIMPEPGTEEEVWNGKTVHVKDITDTIPAKIYVGSEMLFDGELIFEIVRLTKDEYERAKPTDKVVELSAIGYKFRYGIAPLPKHEEVTVKYFEEETGIDFCVPTHTIMDVIGEVPLFSEIRYEPNSDRFIIMLHTDRSTYMWDLMAKRHTELIRYLGKYYDTRRLQIQTHDIVTLVVFLYALEEGIITSDALLERKVYDLYEIRANTEPLSLVVLPGIKIEEE